MFGLWDLGTELGWVRLVQAVGGNVALGEEGPCAGIAERDGLGELGTCRGDLQIRELSRKL